MGYLEQVQAVFVQSRYDFGKGLALVVFELLTFPTFPLWEVLNSWPIVAIGCADYLKDAFEFITFLLPGKQWLHVDHLRKNTSNRPNIDRTRVLLWPQKHIRRSVPKRHNLMRKSFDRNPRGPSQPKICNLQHIVLGDQQILRLEIPMQYFFLMTMSDASDKLIGKTLNYKRIHAFFFAEIVHKLL